MDNNNIGGMNPQQFSQNTPQTSQPHMGMSGIELQKMQQEAEQRRREQSRRNADFFGRLCIPTIIYALLYTIFLYENTGGILVTLFAIVTGVYSLYCMQILHIEAKPLTIWYSVMMILTGLSSGLTGNKIIQGFNFCWILVFLVFMLLHNFCNDRQWGLIKYITAAFQAVFGAIVCIAEPVMDIANYMRNERMDSDNMGSDSMVGDSANATAGERHVKKHRMLYVFIGIAIAFPLVVLIVVLLCSADAVFASVIKKIFADINFFTVSKVVFLFVFALFSSYCGIKYLSKKRISDAPVETPAFPAAIGITVAATISVVYVFFCFIQIVYLFGGLMQLPSGYTYARYAREGFFQLLFVCILNVIIVLLGCGLFSWFFLLNEFLILYVSPCGVVPNPHLSKVYEGIELCKKEGVDFILAVGGGSVIDSCTAIAYGLGNPDVDVWDLFTGKATPKTCYPLGSVLTIAAAGSEMSNSCVITNEEGWYKTHRLGGYTWILAGIVSILHPLHNLVFVTVQLIIFLVGVVPLVYSLVLYFKRKRSN